MDRYLFRGLLAVVFCLMAASASATDFDYDWVTAGPVQQHETGSTAEQGWFVDGSYAVASQFTVQGTLYRLKFDQGGCEDGPLLSTDCNSLSERFDYLRLGAGWHWSFTEKADFLADAYYARDMSHSTQSFEEFNLSTCPPGGVTIPGGCAQSISIDSTDNGYQLDVGLRVRCGCGLEFKGYLGRTGFSGGGSNFASLEAAMQFVSHWALVLDLRHYSSSVDQYRLGLRYLF